MNRTPLAVAVAWVDKHASPRGDEEDEEVELVHAPGRVLARPCAALADIPSTDRAATDGLAMRAEETLGASPYNPLVFRLVPATGSLPPSGAVGVNAGEQLPDGTDAVVPLEQVSMDSSGLCEIVEPVAPGNEVERAGSVVARGAMLLAAGRRLRPYDIGLLASTGVERVHVIRRPRVRIIVTGCDVQRPEAAPSPAAAFDADGPLLQAVVERDGGIVAECRRIERDAHALREAMSEVEADVILVAGGTGLGSNDHAAAVLADLGELAIHGIAVHPGESTGMGRIASRCLVFLLPGAPAACLWGYELLAGRAIRRLAGRSPAPPFHVKEMITRRKIVSRIGMTEICPVRCGDEAGVEPTPPFAEAGVFAAAQADGFVIVPEGSEGYAEGAQVRVHFPAEHDVLGWTAEQPGGES